jgi:HD-like signal output (HDOD) protein
VLARSCSRIHPDEAMLGGMMHGIGKLYVLTRATNHPELFADNVMLDSIVNDWHASIGKAILENWEFSEEMAAAVGDQDDHSREEPADPDLRDIIAIAIIMASRPPESEAAKLDGLEVMLQELPTAQRLGLTKEKTAIVMRECDAEVAALSNALGA